MCRWTEIFIKCRLLGYIELCIGIRVNIYIFRICGYI